jgi:iron complex outermembrane receptor protein
MCRRCLPQRQGQVAKGAGLGLLGNRDVMDAPFNITSYTQQVIADQQSATVAAVLENDPSVRFTTNAGHAYENYTIRGLEVNSSDVSLNGLYGMAPDGTFPPKCWSVWKSSRVRARCSTAWRRAAPWAAS